MQFIRTDLNLDQPKDGICFVIQPFARKTMADGSEFDWDEHYQFVIARAIQECDMKSVLAKDIYGPQPIADNVWRGLVEAEIVVADLTGRNPNVLYELALAHVLGKRVIMLTRDQGDIPVDLRGISYIEYSLERFGTLKLLDRLKKDIQAARQKPNTEYAVTPMSSRNIEEVEVEVLVVTSDYATVRLPGERIGILRAEDWDWRRRKSDLTQIGALEAGKHLKGFYYLQKGEPRFSPRDPRDNPWPRLAQEFPIGCEFTGRVANVVPQLGVFVELRYGINALLHKNRFPENASFERGQEVPVRIARFDADSREIQLDFVGSRILPPPRDLPVGMHVQGALKPNYEKGFVLVRLENRERPVLLPRAHMSRRFVEAFDSKLLEAGKQMEVEVVSHDYSTDKVVVRDVPKDQTASESRGDVGDKPSTGQDVEN